MGKVQSNNYWSSTTNANNTNNAWNVNMNNGNVNNDNKTNNNYVWPVRGGEWKTSCTAPHLFSFKNLYHSYLNCRRNKRNTINALKFEANAEENLFRLSEELQSGRYRPSRSICFVVERPKMREIIAADFRDRVVHHVLVSELEKIYEPVFIHDSYACRVDKGVHSAVERMRAFMRQGTANGNKNKRFYGIHLDIKNFFMTIDKELLFGMIEKKVRKQCQSISVAERQWTADMQYGGNRTDEIKELPAYFRRGLRGGNWSMKSGQTTPACGHPSLTKAGSRECDCNSDPLRLCHSDTLLWLVGVIIFHNPADNCLVKGKKELIPHLPPHKSLFHAGEGRGLPIGNLTSQFFANVYLNALDQYAKHTLKCRRYIRYCDDMHILDESPERLETVKEKLRLFVEENLHLKFNEKHGKVAPITNGIDCLGYIVRPNYTLARRRVVNNLKQRLDWFEKRLVTGKESKYQSVKASWPVIPASETRRESFLKKDSEQVGVTAKDEQNNPLHLPLPKGEIQAVTKPGQQIITYDYPLIEQLRAVVASYWGHLKWANTFRLRNALLSRYWFLKEFFTDDENMPVFTCSFRADFSNVKSQYHYYAARFSASAVFLQVGCFYEVYDNAAWARQLPLKQLKENKRGVLYGFPVKLGDKYTEALLAKGRSVVFVEETGNYTGRLKERLPARKYENINMRMEAYV
jgi:retron-type reverse transcriptase